MAGDAYLLSCAGAEKERIFFYPSINNVPLGGQDRYEVITTLCPGKRSCKGNQQSVIALTLSPFSSLLSLCEPSGISQITMHVFGVYCCVHGPVDKNKSG